MNRILEVCLIAFTLATSVALAGKPVSGRGNPPSGQEMQRGISVQMPVGNSAAPEPEADTGDAKIVTVTEDGDVDFGTDSIALADLAEKLKRTPFIRGQKIYIKADARTPYSKVLEVLEATRNGGIAPQVLLTRQSESSNPGTIVTPKGIEVQVGSPTASDVPVIQILESGKAGPALKINNQFVSGNDLQRSLNQILQNKSEKVVMVEADGRLLFAQVVQVIDECSAIGAKAVMVRPEL